VTTKQKLLKEIKSVILVDTQMLNSQDAPWMMNGLRVW
jgi:hypothetical protein